MQRVIIDDLRTHRGGGVHLRSSTEALAWLAAHDTARIDELWLDHDLGGEDTIRSVVLWLTQRSVVGAALDIGTIYVHSANPVGVTWILSNRQLAQQYALVRAPLDDLAI
jgi:hypothetical protein